MQIARLWPRRALTFAQSLLDSIVYQICILLCASDHRARAVQMIDIVVDPLNYQRTPT